MVHKRWFRNTLIVFTAIILLGAGLLVYTFNIEPSLLLVRTYEIEVSGWRPEMPEIKVAQITDIHAGSPYIDEDKLRLIVEKTNAQQPDIILLTGDFVHTSKRSGYFIHPDVIMEILQDLQAPLGVWSVLGNHDIWYDAQITRGALENAGIPVLHDEAVQLEFQGHNFWLVGITDAFEQAHDIDLAFSEVPEGEPFIAITHTPDLFAKFNQTSGILLAGHTHGGQVVLPFFGRLKVPSYFGERYARGLIEERGAQMFVSTGIGTSILPVRFGNPPEITILILKGVQQ